MWRSFLNMEYPNPRPPHHRHYAADHIEFPERFVSILCLSQVRVLLEQAEPVQALGNNENSISPEATLQF